MYTKTKRWKFFCAEILAAVARTFSRKRHSESQQLWFILGSGRNGSTLLASILNNHESISIPPEQYVLPYSLIKSSLRVFKSKKQVLREIGEDFSAERNTSGWKLKGYELESLIEKSTTVEEFIRKLFEIQTNSTSREIILDQSPSMTHHVKVLLRSFPSAKLIFIFRDPRDVIYSYSKIHNHPAKNYKLAIWKCQDSFKKYLYCEKLGIPVLAVKYEDLVSNIESEIVKIQKFLGIEVNSNLWQMDRDANVLGVENLEIHNNVAKSISKTRIGQWNGKLDSEILKCCELELGELMIKFGYTWE